MTAPYARLSAYMHTGPRRTRSVEPDAEKSGLARHTSASMGSCQRKPRSVARGPRASAEKASAPVSESATSTGCTENIVSSRIAAKSTAGTHAWHASKAIWPITRLTQPPRFRHQFSARQALLAMS